MTECRARQSEAQYRAPCRPLRLLAEPLGVGPGRHGRTGW
jgi:hypothetical protein